MEHAPFSCGFLLVVCEEDVFLFLLSVAHFTCLIFIAFNPPEAISCGFLLVVCKKILLSVACGFLLLVCGEAGVLLVLRRGFKLPSQFSLVKSL